MVNEQSVEYDMHRIEVALGRKPSDRVMEMYRKVQKLSERLNGSGFLTAQIKATVIVLATALLDETESGVAEAQAPSAAPQEMPRRRGRPPMVREPVNA